MKKFVFYFSSNKTKKFSFGEELFNLITTILIFEQSVTLIIKNKKNKLNLDNLSFLSDINIFYGEFNLIFEQENLIKDLKINNNINIIKTDQIDKIISKADYFVNC